jgi:hypothetical protein
VQVFLGTVFSVGALGGALVMPGMVLLWRHRERAQARRSALSRHLLRGPGQSTRDEIEELRSEIALYLSLGMLPIPFALGICLAGWVLNGKSPGDLEILLLSIAAVASLAWLGWKLATLLRKLRQMRLGYEAELAVGQELNELFRYGFRVFHDVPVGEREFNIDHVLVGPTGVFAVETKGRADPTPGADGEAGWEVTYDGAELQFPGWREKGPLQQAETAGAWLQAWLSRIVGERVRVQPVVMLPGWYVKRTGSDEAAPVLSSGQIPSYFMDAPRVLEPKLLQQVAHHIEERCRDVTPAAYGAGVEELAPR